MIEYREARPDEAAYISKLATLSFGHYPFFDFAFQRAFDSENEYFTYIEKLHRVHTRANMKQHKCFVGVRNGRIVSAALLQDPSKRRISVWDYILSGGVSLLFPVGFSKILDFFSISEEGHLDCAEQHPSAWYIELLAVDMGMKGCGLGSGMINDCLIPYIKYNGGGELALTTNTEKNCTFYKRNGFDCFAVRSLTHGGQTIQNWSFVKTV